MAQSNYGQGNLVLVFKDVPTWKWILFTVLMIISITLAAVSLGASLGINDRKSGKGKA